jgi:hypothetical protein
LAQAEISKLLSMNICLPGEQEFFQTVQAGLAVKQDLTPQFQQHIHDIETQYHADQLGKFAALWPEIYNIL